MIHLLYELKLDGVDFFDQFLILIASPLAELNSLKIRIYLESAILKMKKNVTSIA